MTKWGISWLSLSSLNNNLTSTYRQQGSFGSCRIQHHMARSVPTHVSVTGMETLFPAVGLRDSSMTPSSQAAIWKALEMVVLGKHLQTDRAFVEVQGSQHRNYSTVLEQERENMSSNATIWFQIQRKQHQTSRNMKIQRETQNCQGTTEPSSNTDPKDMETWDFLLENPEQLFYEYSRELQENIEISPLKSTKYVTCWMLCKYVTCCVLIS